MGHAVAFFMHCNHVVEAFHRSDPLDQGVNRPSRVSFGEVDFGVIYDRLLEGGFISARARWQPFSEADLSELMAELAIAQKVEFKRYVKPQSVRISSEVVPPGRAVFV